MILKKAAFRVVFNFYEKYLNQLRNGDFSWDELCDEMIETAVSCKNDPLAIDLLLAVHMELERRWKENEQRRTV